MITREQVADLQPGDLVRITGWYGVNVEGPVSEGTHSLWLGQHLLVRDCDGSVGNWAKPDATLTVVSRAPRPLYVNHPRTEAVPGDVVRDADQPEWNGWLYLRSDSGRWLDSSRGEWFEKAMPTRLRLLVDGETGQSVGPDAAEGWAEGFEAAVEWAAHNPGPSGIPHDPPTNPYETGQVVP